MMNFNKDTVDVEIKRINNLDPKDDAAMTELLQDWRFSVAMAVSHDDYEKGKLSSSPVLTKFGSIKNFTKYLTALIRKLKEAGYNINYLNPKISKYVDKAAVEASSGIPPVVRLKPGFVKIIGSSIFTDDSRDLDIYVDSIGDVPEDILKRLQVIFSRLFPGKTIQFVLNNWNGPLESSIDIFDLVLVANPKVTLNGIPQNVEPYEDIDDDMLMDDMSDYDNPNYNISDIDDDVSASAPFKYRRPFEKVYGLNENVSIPYRDYVIQPKYNGMTIIIDHDGNVYSHRWNKLPIDAKKYLKSLPPKGCYIIGEMWSRDYPRQIVVGKVKSGTIDSSIFPTFYDYVDINQIDTLPYSRRFVLLHKYVKPEYITKDFGDNIKRAVEAIKNSEDFDGIIIRNLDAPYSDPKMMFAVKKKFDVDLRVDKIYKTKAGTYLYEVSALCNDKYVPMGKTMATNQKFNVGDIIEVAPLEIVYYGDCNATIYVGRVKGSSMNNKPYTVKEIVEGARKAGVLSDLSHYTEQ